MTVVALEQVRKATRAGRWSLRALKGSRSRFAKARWSALMGPSGSGKTTLMQIIGLLDRPTEGRYLLAGRDVTTLSENERAEVRNQEIGFVFQAFHLLPRLNVLENVEVPLIYAGYSPQERRARAIEVLQKVGLGDKLKNLPSQLSGGQKQRVAIARALAMRPSILLADEPTGNLDSKTAVEVMRLFQELNEEGTCVVIVTHEPDIAEYTERIVRIRDGQVESDAPNPYRKRAVGGLA